VAATKQDSSDSEEEEEEKAPKIEIQEDIKPMGESAVGDKYFSNIKFADLNLSEQT